MKLNHTRKHEAGLTLIEITVVIAVLLGLIAVLFIGVQNYREATNKSRCIMQISAVQKAVRSHQNLNDVATGGTLTQTDLVGTGKLIAVAPVCPSGGTYTWLGTVPAIGTAYLTCSSTGHAPADTAGW
jgi:type II secretory pathway pseudopilin PulG